MRYLLPRSVRGRLWLALTLLSLAILAISGLTWTALQRVDTRLQDLHRQSLSQVAQAVDLSKRTSDLATSAPYLLSQRSNFLIEQESRTLIATLRRVREEWPEASVFDSKRDEIFPITFALEQGINDLVSAARLLDQTQSDVRVRVAVLSVLREEATTAIERLDTDNIERLDWWTLKSMNADALNAAYADNLIGVGEEQRYYQRQRALVTQSGLNRAQRDFLQRLQDQLDGKTGIFELRRIELGIVLDAQNALFRIRRDANHINDLASKYASEAEGVLRAERSASSTTIQLTRLSVASISLIGLACALMAALFVSRYVAFNIGRVSEAMVRLAKGDRSSALPRKLGGSDEIGDLFRSFRSFRANALRLDRSHRQLNQRNALFEKVFANISEGIAITDATGRLTASNPAFAQILGLQTGQPIFGNLVEWFNDSRFGRSARDAELQVTHRGHLELKSKDGQILEIRASRLPDEGRVWLVSDVTERSNIASRVERIDRIETLGKLAGDTAHDFGNILSTIRTHAHLLQTSNDDKISDHLSAIENAVDFGGSLTDRLLAFARKQPLVPEVVDLNALIEGMFELIEIGLKPGVTFKVRYSNEPIEVLADPGQLESAILNLVLNANNAMPHGGVVEIGVSRLNDGQAEIAVTDTGIGMAPEIMQKAIEPFFTTRIAEGGTGLGLSIVYGFFNQTGGTLEIDSTEGKGSTVRGTLPIFDGSHQTRAMTSQRALLLDDNLQDRMATETVLKTLGFSTTVCASFQEAQRQCSSHQFDLVISDFDLGTGSNGIDFLSYVKTSRPDARRILMSGKTLPDLGPESDVLVMAKPVTQHAMAKLL